MATKTRLNMEHGFMQSIIRNQVDRDKYDKEVKATQASKKPSTKCNHSGGQVQGAKARKPRVQMYQPPSFRQSASQEKAPETKECQKGSKESNVLFKFEYEDEHGHVYRLDICKDSDVVHVSQELGEALGMTTPMKLALANFLKIEAKKRTSNSRPS